MNGFALCKTMDAAGKLDSPDRALALATGQAGDVYLCHPFLITPHNPTTAPAPGSSPASAMPIDLLDLGPPDGAYSPVEHGRPARAGAT